MQTTKPQHGFTLIELLVVIAIIAILAATLMPQLSKAREQGYASRCKVNLRNLAQGALNFSADQNGELPFAGGYEVEDRNGWFHERVGWVTWMEKTYRKRGDYPYVCPIKCPTCGAEHGLGSAKSECPSCHKTWQCPTCKTYPWPKDASGFDKMNMPSFFGAGAKQAIEEGSLWTYVSKDFSTYCCPKFRRKSVCGKSDVMRSYAMNRFFGFRDNARWYHHNMINLGRDSSRLLLFSEMCPRKYYLGRPATEISVISASDSSGTDDAGDGVLDPGEVGTGGVTVVKPYESIGYVHPMNGEFYGHVVFVDGHVEAFTLIKTGSAITTNITARLCSGDY